MCPKKLFLFTFFSLILILNCQSPTEVEKDIIAGKEIAAITPVSFNWEDPNLNWMPYPSNQPKITVPWTGQGSLVGVIPQEILDDRKSSDGWVLVYNSFSNTVWNLNPYFVLYNKYRGLYRIYQYINSISGVTTSTYLQTSLVLQNTSNSSILRFAGTPIADVSTLKQRYDQIV
jgi:hypothetical protein